MYKTPMVNIKQIIKMLIFIYFIHKFLEVKYYNFHNLQVVSHCELYVFKGLIVLIAWYLPALSV